MTPVSARPDFCSWRKRFKFFSAQKVTDSAALALVERARD